MFFVAKHIITMIVLRKGINGVGSIFSQSLGTILHNFIHINHTLNYKDLKINLQRFLHNFIHYNYTLIYKDLKINLQHVQRLWLVTNQYSDLNLNLEDLI